jgi:hypothetical protein
MISRCRRQHIDQALLLMIHHMRMMIGRIVITILILIMIMMELLLLLMGDPMQIKLHGRR